MALRFTSYNDIFTNDYTDVLSAMIESADFRDSIDEDMICGDTDSEIQEFKAESVEDEIMDTVIDKIPETSIDDAIATLTKTTNTVSDVSDEEIIGAPLEDYTIYLVREYEYVTEGWGVLLSTLSIYGILGTMIVSAQTMDRIIKQKEFQKYLKKTVKEVTTKYQRKHKCKITKNTYGIKFTLGNIGIVDNLKTWLYVTDVDGWEVYAYGDTDHIEQMLVWVRREDNNKNVAITIPAPTKKDLGYRREWSTPSATNESSKTPLTEGWGMFFTTLFGGWGTWIVADQISKSTIKRIMKDKKMQNYIKSAMKARIEKYKKTHKGDKIKNGKPNSINLGYGFNKGNGTIRDWMSANKMNMNIDGYTVCLWADSDHIENVGVWIYNETQDKMELLTLPPPKGKELQAFRREWSNPDDE